VACIAGPDGLELSDERVQGFRQTLQAAGAGRGDLLHADFSGIGGYQAAMQCREDEGQRPDAIFCCNDMMAIGVLRAAGELQIECRANCRWSVSTISNWPSSSIRR
jgi:LacI family transcriptional regulator